MPTISEELAPIILEIVQCIPYGQVASYGQVARLAGVPRHARLVGKVLSNLADDSEIPWHRVINSAGKVTHTRANEYGENIQILKLRQEGILVINKSIDLKKSQWNGYVDP